MLKKIYFYCVSLLDSLFPKRVNAHIVSSLSPDELISLPPPHTNPLPHIQSLYTYKDPRVKAIIWELKYHGETTFLSTIGRMLYEEMIQTIADIRLFDRQARFALIPVPIHPHTRQERGYNQSEYIARSIIQYDTHHILLYAPQWLEKTKLTQRQSHTHSRQERLHNLSFAYRAHPNVSGYYVFLVDDVTTTGSTLQAAKETLQKSGSKAVYGFTIAH